MYNILKYLLSWAQLCKMWLVNNILILQTIYMEKKCYFVAEKCENLCSVP